MSTVFNHPETAAADGTVPTLTVTHYQQVAAEVSAAVASALSKIAPLEAPHPTTRDFVRANASVDDRFIASVIAAVESNPELQTPKFDVNEARDMLQFHDAFRPVLDQIEVLARNLKFTIDGRKAKTAEEALHVYALAKRYAKNPNSGVLAHVEIMRRELGRTFPHPRVKKPVPPANETEVQKT